MDTCKGLQLQWIPILSSSKLHFWCLCSTVEHGFPLFEHLKQGDVLKFTSSCFASLYVTLMVLMPVHIGDVIIMHNDSLQVELFGKFYAESIKEDIL